MTAEQNKQIVVDYINQVWNNQNLGLIDQFIHEEYLDYSFPDGVPGNKVGLKFWIEATTAAFRHHTIIETILAEGDVVMVRISFKVKHTGKWRNIEPSGKEAQTKGFRQFLLNEGKIAAHWGLLDGEQLEAALTNVHHGCLIPANNSNSN